MSLVFFGSPTFAVPSLGALLEAGQDVRAVVTQTDKPTGRGKHLCAPAVKEFALARGIPVLQPRSMKDEEFLSELAALSPEFIVVVAYGRILTRAVLDAPSIAPVNLHASLLPRYRGASPIAWAILNGETETGITTMIITEPLDEGDMLLQERHPIRPDDTTESLSLRLSVAGGPLLVKTLRGLRDGTLKPVPQAGQSSYVSMLKKSDGKMDFNRSARELDNFVRGMHPWPGAFCYITGQRVKVLGARAASGSAEPGSIATVGPDLIAVGTGGGLLELLVLQPEGGKPMDAGAFLKGRTVREGDRIR